MAEKKIIKVGEESADKKKAVKKAEETVKKAKTETAAKEKKIKDAAPAHDKADATKFRIGAVISWVIAIGFEVLAFLILGGVINITFIPQIPQLIIALVLDLAFVILGSQLWKKANHIDPISKTNEVKFWLWNNMGIIVCAFAFIPFVIYSLTNKKADKKTKTIAAIVAVIALLIGVLVGADWNPISKEEKEEVIQEYKDVDVFWAPFGHVYHLTKDCSHLNQSESLYQGSVEKAIQESRSRVCKTCEANNDKGEIELTPSTPSDDAEKNVEGEDETADETVTDSAADTAK